MDNMLVIILKLTIDPVNARLLAFKLLEALTFDSMMSPLMQTHSNSSPGL